MSENDARMDAYRMVLEDSGKRKLEIEAAIAGITSLNGRKRHNVLHACSSFHKAKSLVTSSLVHLPI